MTTDKLGSDVDCQGMPGPDEEPGHYHGGFETTVALEDIEKAEALATIRKLISKVALIEGSKIKLDDSSNLYVFTEGAILGWLQEAIADIEQGRW